MREMLRIHQLIRGDIFIDELGERWMVIERHKERFVVSMESALFVPINEGFSDSEIVERVSTTH